MRDQDHIACNGRSSDPEIVRRRRLPSRQGNGAEAGPSRGDNPGHRQDIRELAEEERDLICKLVPSSPTCAIRSGQEFAFRYDRAIDLSVVHCPPQRFGHGCIAVYHKACCRRIDEVLRQWGSFREASRSSITKRESCSPASSLMIPMVRRNASQLPLSGSSGGRRRRLSLSYRSKKRLISSCSSVSTAITPASFTR